MFETDENRLAHWVNATNPSQIELLLSIGPGHPESLEEALERIRRGEPVVQPDPDAPAETEH